MYSKQGRPKVIETSSAGEATVAKLEALTTELVQEVLDEFVFPEGVPSLKEAGVEVSIKFVGSVPCYDPVFGPRTFVYNVLTKSAKDHFASTYEGKIIDVLAALVCRHGDSEGVEMHFRSAWHTLSGALFAKGLDPITAIPFPDAAGPPPIGLAPKTPVLKPKTTRLLNVLEVLDLQYKSMFSWAPWLTKVRIRAARWAIKFFLGETEADARGER